MHPKIAGYFSFAIQAQRGQIQPLKRGFDGLVPATDWPARLDPNHLRAIHLIDTHKQLGENIDVAWHMKRNAKLYSEITEPKSCQAFSRLIFVQWKIVKIMINMI